MALVAYSLSGRISHTRHDKARYDISHLSAVLAQYMAVHGRYPSGEKGLNALIDSSSEGQSYQLNRLPRDPWGTHYHYRYPGDRNSGGFDMWSYGADNQVGGENKNKDINNW